MSNLNNELPSSQNSDEINWLVDENQIVGNTEIYPEIDSLTFQPLHNYQNTISDKHRVALANIDNNNYVFLHGDLSYFETMNFSINSNYYSITHCPITNTTLLFKQNEGDKIKASGYRYKDNLIYHNTSKETYSSQMLEKVIGYKNPLRSEIVQSIPIIDSEWSEIKNRFDNLKIAIINDIDLGTFTEMRNYGDQQSLNWNITSVSFNNNKVKSSIDIFDLNEVNSNFFSFSRGNYNILGIKSDKLVRVFNTSKSLTIDINGNYFSDNENNKYNWNGVCFEGENQGNSIPIINSYTGSTNAFYNVFDIVNKLN